MIKGNNEKLKAEMELKNIQYHLQGQYFAEALLSTVGNMFKKKAQKPHEYPNKPFEFKENKKELSEEELQKQRELFVAKLQVMKANFDLNKKNKEVESQ